MASPTRALSPHEAYMQRMKAECPGPLYDRFIEVLSRSTRARQDLDFSRCLRVVDFDGNNAPKVVLRADVSGNLQEEVYAALKSELPAAATRVVLVHYPVGHCLSIEYVGTVGHMLDVDPLFFIKHFDFQVKYWAKSPKTYVLTSPRQLDTRILQFGLAHGAHLTACVVQNVGKSL
jgi:hypothetical protein